MTEPEVRRLGRWLRRWCRSDAGLSILDRSERTKGCGWTTGGCWVLARTLTELLPSSSGAELWAIVDQSPWDADLVVHHFVVKIGRLYLDGDGYGQTQTLIRRLRREAWLHNPSLVLATPLVRRWAREQGIPCPSRLVSATKRALTDKLRRLG